MSWRYEICSDCGKSQRVAWAVTDEVWAKVVGDSRILCLECFLKRANEKGIEIKREDLVFFDLIAERSIRNFFLSVGR